MIEVRVDYHHEDGTWWADSPDLEGWVAGGETLEQARQQVHEGLRFFLDDEVELLEGEVDHPVVVSHVVTSGLQGWPTDATSAATLVKWRPTYIAHANASA